MREKFATVKWSINDVLALRPNWTRIKAAEFLANIENDLEEAMIREGWEVLHLLLDVEFPD